MFQYRGTPPFQNVYEDHSVYLRALVGDDVDGAIAHFRKKLADANADEVGSGVSG